MLQRLLSKNKFTRALCGGAFLSTALCVTFIPAAYATESWQNTNVTLGYTTKAKFDPVFGTGTGDEKLTSLRLEHFGVWGYGDNYFFAETDHGKNIGNIPAFSAAGFNAGSFADNTNDQYYIVWNPRLSLSKISGTKLSLGIIEDIYLAGRFERGSYANFGANNYGVAVDLKIPGFSFFETDLYSRSNRFTGNTVGTDRNLFWRTYAMLPFEVAGLKFTWAPLLLANFRKDDRGTNVFIQPDLWVKLNSSVDLGYRHEYNRYKKTPNEGGGTFSRTTPTLLVRWNF